MAVEEICQNPKRLDHVAQLRHHVIKVAVECRVLAVPALVD